MAITQDEIQNIINAVLSAIRTNSLTIEQLTPVTSLNDEDCIEISGGKRVNYAVIRELIKSLSSTEHDSIRNLINKNELKSVSITTTDATVTISISSNGKTIISNIPVASADSAGIMTASDNVKLKNAYDKAEIAQSGVDSINERIAAPSGIAPLDKNGLIPARFIPGAMDDVVEFAGIIDLVPEVQPKGENDRKGCVVYCSVTKKFIWEAARTLEGTATYYNDWDDGRYYGELTDDGRSPSAGKVYIDTTTNKQYRWSGTTMAVVGTDLALGHTAQTAYPGNEGFALSKQVFSIQQALPEKLGAADKEELENSIGEVADDVTNVANDLSAYKADTGIYPFAGTIPKAEHVSQKEAGSVWYAAQEGYFVTHTGGTPSHSLPHNSHNDVGGEPLARQDLVYRCGTTFYRHDGSGLMELESSVLRAYITSVKNGAKNELFDLEERLPVFRFDGVVQSLNNINNGCDVDTIWYVIEEECFFQCEETGLSPFLHLNEEHIENGSFVYYARQDAIFYWDGDLFRFDGESLVDWEPWKLREDVDALNTALTETANALNTRIDSHTTETGIYPFDGTVATVDDIDTATAVAGSVWFLKDDGYFVKVTDDGVDSNIPHNGPRKEHVPVKARGGVLFRQGSQFFRFDGSGLIAVTDDAEVIKRALFDDMWASINGTKLANGNYRMGADGKELTYAEALVRYERNGFIKKWNAACSQRFFNSAYYPPYGQYNEATGFFELNGITDIDYTEAVRIYMAYVSGRTTTGYRTNIPVGMANYQDAAAEIRMFTNTEVEKIYGNFSPINAEVLNTGTLREIKTIRLGSGSNSVYIQSASLEIIYFSAQNKSHYPCKINISNAAKFRLDGIAQIVDWVNNSTVLVHPDVYAKLTGDTTNAAAAALTEEELTQWMEMAAAADNYNIIFATT